MGMTRVEKNLQGLKLRSMMMMMGVERKIRRVKLKYVDD
jgi:hypothetical protein